MSNNPNRVSRPKLHGVQLYEKQYRSGDENHRVFLGGARYRKELEKRARLRSEIRRLLCRPLFEEGT